MTDNELLEEPPFCAHCGGTCECGEYLDDEPCDHEHADYDLLVGRMSCNCGFTKWLSTEELEAELKLQAECAEVVATHDA